MKLIDLKCEHCGANLKLDPDKLQAFCQYCGNKLLIDMDRLSEILKEKEKTKQVIEKEQHITKRKEMFYNREKEKQREDIKLFLTIVGVFVALMFIFPMALYIEEYIEYLFIGLGIALGLVIGLVLYKKFIQKK